jgi:hypothetical protein
MERISDLYNKPIEPENTQWENPIYNENNNNNNRLTLIEESLNRSLLINQNESNCSLYRKIFLGFLLSCLALVIVVIILISIDKDKLF